MTSNDWWDIGGWTESITSWSMDNVHDLMPSEDIDLQVTIPSTWAWPNSITIGPIFNMQDGFASIQPALESFMNATIMCTVVFGMMMTTMLAIPYIERTVSYTHLTLPTTPYV